MRVIVLVLAVAGMAAVQQTRPDDGLPPGHPPLNPLPPGHPPVEPPPTPAPIDTGAAAPDDVASARGVVGAYYDSISGPVGTPRDWDRFRSLFLPQARLVAIRPGPATGPPVVMSPEEFARINRRYLESSGYIEESIYERLESFGDVAHLWSTYAARRGADAEPHLRGIASFQLVRTGGRWWILSVLWDREREGVAVPAEYLPPAAEGP